MTFIFDTFSGLLFFGAFFALLWIVLNGMGPKREPEWCPMHPGQKTCAHRPKRKE